MSPLVLEGDTLGKRHQHYNKLLNKVIAGEMPYPKSGKIIPEELDIENFLKIDIASNNKDVVYILEVLKSEDMLYVSRAIKRCTWLITDPQYAHIINPEYLHSQLFLLITSKARNKLMLQIRLHLRDESRVEAFYNHFKDNNLETAFKWLQYCSLSFIEKEIVTHHEKLGTDMPWFLFKRLCERSFTFLKILCEHYSDYFYYKKYMSGTAMFLINTHTDEFLNLIESFEATDRPKFSAKYTALIMKKCPQRIVNNFDKYANIIDTKTFGKTLEKEDIKDFILKHVQNKTFKSWDFYKKKHIVRHMPEEGRFEFLKKTFMEKETVNFYVPSSFANIYRWYLFAPFDIALTDLTKLVRSESSPEERNTMLSVLISCAGHNTQHTQTVLQYYHDKHINEPFKFKIQFVNTLLSQTATHRFDEKTWNILNNIFCSMEVYIESNNNVQSCIESIIVYKVLHNKKVPKTIENKFKFSSLKSEKYNNEEKEKIFNYLLTFLRNKMRDESISHETELKEAVGLIENVVFLLIDWKKDLVEYPWVLNVIKQLTKIQKENNWKVDFKPLFNNNKSWRKLMFEESLVMSPSENTCLNALKHDTGLLTRHKNEIEALRRNDAVSLRRMLGKLRVYWPQTLACEWTDSYLNRLNETGGHKSLTIGLCTLLPQSRLIEILRKYAPTESRINWSDEELVLSLRKHFAKNAYLARPLLPPDVILPYAQGDYLQYVLPSINAILDNASPTLSRQYIPKLLDAPVSLQKHGIRFVFTKLNSSELKETLPNIWKSAKNRTIRAVIFKATYELLCQKEKPSMIEEIWEILSTFIDNLSVGENKIIFRILGEVEKVPLIVRAKYCMKSHKYLKSLPANANCESIAKKVLWYIDEIMEYLDEDFVDEILLDALVKKFTTQIYDEQIMVSYLLSAKTEESQIKKFDRILGPLLDRSFALWNLKVEDSYFVRKNVNDLLKCFCRLFITIFFEKDVVFPVKMFTEILKKLEGKFTVEYHFVMMRFWRMTTKIVILLEEQQVEEEQQTKLNMTWNEAICANFAESCLQCLWEDIELYCPSVWLAHADALEKIFRVLDLSQQIQLLIIKHLLREEFIESYLFALKAFPWIHSPSKAEYLLGKEIQKKIYFHPSPEVKVHYCQKFELDPDF